MHFIILFFACMLNFVRCDDFYTRTFSLPLRVFDGRTTYYCISQPIAADQFIVEFQPLVERDLIKHMSFSLCDEPFSTDPMWDCMGSNTVCKQRRESVYAWTNYAPGLKFPSNTGYHTGNKPRYIVFQMHGPPEGSHGSAVDKIASMAVTFRSSRPEYIAASGALGNTGEIPPKVKGFKTDSACYWNISQPAPLFSYALHSHFKGRTAAGYIIRNGKWTEIGKGDPRYPVTYFDISHKGLFLQAGDIVVLRCTFDNPSRRYIKFGHHANDEMCNIFLFYGIPLDAPIQDRSHICSNNAKMFHWEDHFRNIPSDSTDISGDTEQRIYANTHKEFILKY